MKLFRFGDPCNVDPGADALVHCADNQAQGSNSADVQDLDLYGTDLMESRAMSQPRPASQEAMSQVYTLWTDCWKPNLSDAFYCRLVQRNLNHCLCRLEIMFFFPQMLW